MLPPTVCYCDLLRKTTFPKTSMGGPELRFTNIGIGPVAVHLRDMERAVLL